MNGKNEEWKQREKVKGSGDEMRSEVVRVKAPSRLHFSLIDLNGSLGRVDGGIGVALEEPYSLIEVSKIDSSKSAESAAESAAESTGYSANSADSSDSTAANSAKDAEIMRIVNRVRENLDLKYEYRVRVIRKLPSHVGLGSKTQLALSIAKGISTLEGLNISVRELAKVVGRGGTSGIGVAAFERGGFILDAGHRFVPTGTPLSECETSGETFGETSGEATVKTTGEAPDVKTSFLPSSASRVPPPPVLFQHPLPDDWFFVVVTPFVSRGAHGAREIEIFREYCPIRSEEVAEICRIVLMRILPSIVERDIETFASSLTMLQRIGFKRIEVELQHEIIKKLFSFFEKHDSALGYGMSSFGPTTYAVVKGKRNAIELSADTQNFLDEMGVRASVNLTKTNNRGALMEAL